MQADRHEAICQIIDKSLAGTVSAEEQHTLREHLQGCAQCQEYLASNNRAIASLGGYSFDVTPGLERRVLASLSLRAAQLEAKQPRHWQMAVSCLLALMLTCAGSLVASQLGRPVATAFHMEPEQMQFGLLAFWVLPSLCFSLLLPFLPSLSSRWMEKKGWML